MRKDINFVKSSGQHSRQAHRDLPEGSFEREMGREGFFGAATHLYHRRPPTSWTNIEGPMKPRLFHGEGLFSGELLNAESELLVNSTCRVATASVQTDMTHLVRNADGDTLLFVHSGEGLLFCDFGTLDVTSGDYIVIPRGVMFRIETAGMKLLTVEATGSHYQLPDKGMLGPHAIFDPAVLVTPEIDERFQSQHDNAVDVRVKSRQQWSTISYPHNPLDALGWKGDNLVVKVNWRDICPVMSHRYHVPPSAHTTFVAPRFVVCTFAPRLIETDPTALKVPFYHSNDDFEELIFYHQGEFFSRDNVEPGSLTLHPMGLPHGPHPKALEKSWKEPKAMTDEVAVMIDARDPWDLCDHAIKHEWSGYVHSWKSE
jgi:homogentisate 1,2-dioxygenase